MTELRWLAGRGASSLCAAAAILDYRSAADAALAEVLAAPAAALAAVCRSAEVAPEDLLAHLIPLSPSLEAPEQLAEVALTKLLGSRRAGEHVGVLADVLRRLEAAMLACRPQLAAELALRGGPLREQWEARGPGLLAAIGRLTQPAVLISQADVVLVHPFLGGGGHAWLDYRSVTLEAVLANPHADLPEVVRLGWLLAQLNLDPPASGEPNTPRGLPRIGPLAMLCVTLSAAEEVELARCGEPSIAQAIACWGLDVPAAVSADLSLWWDAYRASRPPWPDAVGALRERLESQDVRQ